MNNPESELKRLHEDWEWFQSCGMWKRVAEYLTTMQTALASDCAREDSGTDKRVQGRIAGIQTALDAPEKIFESVKDYYGQQMRRQSESNERERLEVERAGKQDSPVSSDAEDDY